MNKLLLLLLSIGCMISCQPQNEDGEPGAIVCTTGMIGDAVLHLMGDSAAVEVLMGPGVDPHLYKATQGDIQNLSQADVIVYNGLHLEGKMGEIFEKLEDQKLIIAASKGVAEDKLINSTDFQGAHDPHIWFDVSIWMEAVSGISEQLQNHYPQWKSYIRENEKAYLRELQELHEYCLTQVQLIPEDQRIMITAHDAFKYFGKAYGIEVRGLQGISTTAEYGLRDISDLVKFITTNKVKAIFVESSVPRRSINAVIEGCEKSGHEVDLGGELYSDAMGAEGTSEGTYIGMVKHNVSTIVNALK